MNFHLSRKFTPIKKFTTGKITLIGRRKKLKMKEQCDEVLKQLKYFGVYGFFIPLKIWTLRLSQPTHPNPNIVLICKSVRNIGHSPTYLNNFALQNISQSKLKMFNIGSMNIRKGMTKREKDEEKKKVKIFVSVHHCTCALVETFVILLVIAWGLELAHLNTIVKCFLFVRTRCKHLGYAQVIAILLSHYCTIDRI